VTTLLESKARPYGSKKGAALSVVLHTALIALAIVGTSRAVLPEREKIEEHSILYVAPPPPKIHVAPDPLPEVKKPPPPTKKPAVAPPRARAPEPPRRAAAPTPRPAQPTPQAPPVRGVPLMAPINVPTTIPAVDLKGPPTVIDVPIPPSDPARLAGSSRSRATSSSDGDVDGDSRSKGLSSGASNKAYSENQVDRAVQLTRAAVPRYPDALKSVNVTGEVVVQYVVDQRGRVEPGSIKILSSTHRLFGEAVRRALLEARFRPAEVGGQPVRQLVEQPFIFKLEAQ
jgi:TonB family protein